MIEPALLRSRISQIRGRWRAAEDAMDAREQVRKEHEEIRREMDAVEGLFADPDPARFDDLRGRMKGLWILILRHEQFEERWLAGGWGGPAGGLSAPTQDILKREHGRILGYMESLEGLLDRIRTLPGHYWRREADRETIRAQVAQVFRAVRDHMALEEEKLFPRPAGLPTEARSEAE